MNNSAYGKNIENVRNRVDVRIVRNAKSYRKLIRKLSLVSQKIFNKNLTAVHKIKEVLTPNKPTYVGICILNLNKTLLYDFPYIYIRKTYGHKAKL